MIKNFNKQIISSVDVKDKVVLVRVDYNVPLEANGSIADDKRIRASLDTIRNLIDREAKQVILLSHMGRPKGYDASVSLAKVAVRLEKLLERKVEFIKDFHGFNANEKVVLLENLRFWDGEAENSLEFAQEIVKETGADLFVEDGFSVCHRASATTVAICEVLPAYASQKLADEYTAIQNFTSNMKRPVLAIMGGAKISDKIEFAKVLANISDQMVIGGAMANIFLNEDGVKIGNSLIEENQSDVVKEIKSIMSDKELVLPIDVVVGDDLKYKSGSPRELNDIEDDEMILDLGLKTQDKIIELIRNSGSVVWNGNLGYTENPVFQSGTSVVVEALDIYEKPALIGGGDTVGFINQLNPDLNYDGLVISTGGGAMLDLVATGNLIGVDSLLDA